MSTREDGFKFFRSLVDRYEGVVKKLDTTVGEAIVLLKKANQKSDFLETQGFQRIVGLLDEAVFQLRVWASDLAYQNFVSKSEKLAMRDLSSHDVLNIVDASQTPIVGGLHRTFDQIENNILTFARDLESMTGLDKDKWTSYCASLDTTAGRIEQGLVELDNHKAEIREQINRSTAEDFERGLFNDGVISGKASVLSIDGGGVRSYSSILIIKALMEQVRSMVGDGKPDDTYSPGAEPVNVRPSDVFEYVFGSSSGGLIAIMLGRLKMSEDQCLESFRKYADEVFSHRQLASRLFRSKSRIFPKYGPYNINRAIQMVVGNFDPSPDSHKWKRNLFAVPGEKCKTGVTAYAVQGSAASTHIFRTYNQTFPSERSLPRPAADYQIWEVARATSAAPYLFPPMTIGQTDYLDGGFGTNNPARQALGEVQASRKAMSPSILLPKILIISVGSGVRSQASISDSLNTKYNLIATARSFISDTETVHRDMEKISEREGIDYFRFAVESSLSDLAIDSWEVRRVDGKKTFVTLEAITEATQRYIEQESVANQLRQCARLLVDMCKSNPFSPRSVSSLSTIPLPQDRDFVGREAVLDRVQKTFEGQNHVALVGLGGIRKTHIAIEYGYRHRARHPSESVFWVNAGTSSTFERSLRSIARVLKLTSREEAKADVFRLVYNWLRYDAKDGWLMILDNVDDEDILDEPFGLIVPRLGGPSGELSVSMSALLPQNPEGKVLVTSRSKDIAFKLIRSYETVIEVEAMSAAESIGLLLKKLPIEEDRGDAKILAEALEGLPLAIVQATAYIARRSPRFTVRDYLAKYWEQPEKIFAMRDNGPRYESPFYRTWETTFEFIRGHKPSAWRLLSLMSLCGPENIPDYLVRHYQENSKDSGGLVDLDFEDDISTLTSYSLIRMNSRGNLFRMYRLVQSGVKRLLETLHELIIWKQKYLVILAEVFPERIYDSWERCEVLSTHVSTALTYRPDDERHLHYWTTILIRIARYAEARGDYQRAGKLSIRALEESEKLLGPDHSKTLEIVDNLALIRLRTGMLEEADAICRRALEGRQKLLGQDHPDTMTSQSRLADILLAKGDVKAAEGGFQQIFAKRRKVLGIAHPDTFISLYNLSLVFIFQERLEEAEKMNRQALERQMDTLGADHPYTLLTMSNLALVLLYRGEFEEAEQMYREALKGKMDTLGADHPHTLSTMSNLASVLRDHGKLEEAERMNREVLKGQVDTLGADHPHTLSTLSNLASVLRDQGKLEETERMNREALKGQVDTLGVEHAQLIL